MAPNRKSPTLFASNLESLNIPLKAEFLPLTDPREEAAQQQQQKPVQHDYLTTDAKTEKTPPTVSYWDWQPDTAEEEKLAAVDDIFSLSRFESNLIADSIRRENSTAHHVPVENGNEEQTKEQQSYWDWSNDDINVVEPETDSQDEKITQLEERHGEECCEDYWSWDPKVTEEHHHEHHHESPSHRLHQVLSESRKKFNRQHSHLPEPEERDEVSKSHHYWHWLEFRRTAAK